MYDLLKVYPVLYPCLKKLHSSFKSLRRLEGMAEGLGATYVAGPKV